MTIEFERTMYQISGRSITITSWYDEGADSWSASAPNYCNLLSKSAVNGFPSRKAAEEKTAVLLRALLPPRPSAYQDDFASTTAGIPRTKAKLPPVILKG